MNTKSFLVCFIVVMLATSMATAGTHHGHFAPAQGGFVRNGTGSFHGGNWNGGNWNGRSGSGNWNGRWGGGNWNGGNWHHHHHDGHSNDFVFIGSFGFPFFGYPYGYGYYPYSYGYSPYGYGYGSGYYGSGSGYYGYGAGYYGNSYYGNGYYRSGYYRGYGYNGNRSGVVGRSSVIRLQQQLARAGYYRGPIDGIMGTRTRYALRAYQHDHGTASL
jgi:Putative peptidoglycan binding domain